jgi:hypothetical protein
MKHVRQLNLFVRNPSEDGPLYGLSVRLPDACRCRSYVAQIGAPVTPHLAELHCTSCSRHRGWLPREAHQFLTEVINKFGRPAAPITIRRGKHPRAAVPAQTGEDE